MADLDLRTLSAPIEALRSKVDAAYKLLDEQWKAITVQLSELPIPTFVDHVYWSSDQGTHYMGIAWRKVNGTKRICSINGREVTLDDGSPDFIEDVVPYEEWSAQQRLAMLEHVPGLFKAATKVTEAFIKKVHGKGGCK